MDRKRSFRFRRIFTVAFDRLFQVNVNDCPVWARNRKATVKIRINPLLRFLSMIQKFSPAVDCENLSLAFNAFTRSFFNFSSS